MKKHKSVAAITKNIGWKTPILLIVIATLFFVILAMAAFTGAAPSIGGYELPAFASTGSVADLTASTGGKTLSNNTTYKVTSSITCSNSNAGGNGITIADNATVVIFVASGCTLTCTGGAGSGATGGGAGIYIPSNSTLIITGAGTVKATGGKAGAGSAGSTGGNAYLEKSGREWYGGGTGGAGGKGGGGAGAGIGGKGGTGGNGGAQTGRPEMYTTDGNYSNGYDGNAGSAGGNGTTMGQLWVLGSVSVTGTAGAANSGGGGGARGSWADDQGSGWKRYFYAGYGGGGGGGGGGYAASAIGGGGAGGGGGGSGGSGGVDNFSKNKGYGSESAYSNGAGGSGGTGSSNGTGGSGTRSGPDYKGGYGGGGGGAGSGGGAGTLYKAGTATVSGRSADGTQTTHSSVQWSVTFNNQDATSAGTTSTTVTLGATNNGITAPSRTGYTFGGYYTSTNGGGTQYYNASGAAARAWDLPAATTLYAKWTPITYTIKVDTNGADGGSMNRPSIDGATQSTGTTGATYDSICNPYNFKNLTRTGYIYAGVKMTGGSSQSKWNYYHTQYGDGTGGSNKADKPIANNTLFAQDNGDINVINLATTQGATVTLTVQWTPITYTLEVNFNDGSASGNLQSRSENLEPAYDFTTTTTLTYDLGYNIWNFQNNSTRTGYLYDGLKMSGGESGALWGYWSEGQYSAGAIHALANDTKFAESNGDINVKNLTTTQGAKITFTIQWIPITYTVGYSYAGGAENGTMPTSWTYDVAQAVPSPTRAGYTFAGWTVTSGLDTSTAKWGTGSSPSIAISATTTQCGNGASSVYFKNLTPISGGSVTLTATWSASTYTLTYDAQGGSVSPTGKSVTFASSFGDLATPTRTGYTFLGWRLIPAEYQQVEYISTNGSGGFVITDLVPTGKSSMRMVMMPNSVAANQNLWCARGANTNAQTFTMFALPTALRYDYGNTTGSNVGSIAANTKYVVSAEKNRGWLSGTTALSAYGPMEHIAGGPLVFMASYYGGYNYANKTISNPGNYGNMKMYGATVWDNGTVSGYFVPCYRKSDNAIGLYDIVNNKFHVGAGSGLTKGGDVYITSSTEFAVGKNTTIYAVWKANNYTFKLYDNYTFAANGDSAVTFNSIGSGTATYDSTMPTVTVPTRTGYTFLGYYDGVSGGTQYINANGTGARTCNFTTNNKALYAHWQDSTYNVVFNANTGTAATGIRYIRDYDYGSTGNQWTHLGEIQAWTFDGVNKAKYPDNSVVKVNGGTPSGSGASASVNIVDGQINSNYGGGGTVTIDLGAIYNIEYLIVQHYPDRVYFGTKTEVSADGVNWSTVFDSGSSGYQQNGPRLYAEPATGHKIYVAQKSTALPMQEIHVGHSEALRTNVCSRTNYDLLGWSTSASATTPTYTPGQAVTNLGSAGGTVTLYAVWRGVPTTLTINPNGGTYGGSTSDTTINSYFAETSSVAAPTRTGYTFTGWEITPTNASYQGTMTITGSQSGFSKTPMIENGVVFTRYSFNVAKPSSDTWYSIRFPAYTFTAGHTYELILVYRTSNVSGTSLALRHARMDNDFQSTMSNLSASASSWTTLRLTTTFQATSVRSGTEYTTSPRVEFYTGSLKSASTDPVKYTVDIKNIVVLDKSNNEALSYNSLYTYTHGLGATLKATWAPITYNIDYSLSGGSYSEAQSTVWTYDSVKAVPVPTRTGYTFTGWKVTSGLNAATAKWGTNSSPATAIANSSTVCFNTATASVYFKNLTASGGSTVTLTATWTANKYTVGYNYAGGTNGASEPTAWTYDVAQEVSAPTRAGYTFAGWKVTSGLNAGTAKWGTNSSPATAIADGSAVCFNTATTSVYFKNLTPVSNGAVTLTATWAAVQYVLSYDANGGSVSSASKTVAFGTGYGELLTPTRTGYIFKGWSLVPAEYAQLDYIQAAGAGRVLTDIVPTATGSIRMVEAQTSLSGTQTYWAARGGSGSQDRTMTLFFINGKMRYDYNTTTGAENFTPSADVKYVISAEKNSLWVNGTTLVQKHTASGSFTVGGPLMFMSSYSGGDTANAGNPSYMKLYGVTIWTGSGAASAYLVPCYRRSDGANGLYDIIGNRFFAATGTVTRGSEVFLTAGTEFAVGKNTTVRAVWQAKTYNVNLDANFATTTGNTTGDSSFTAEYDSYVPTGVAMPVKSGFTFLGYYSGSVQYYNETGTPVRVWTNDVNNMTLTARWAIKDVSLSATADFSSEYNVGTKTLTVTPSHGCAEIAYSFAWNYNNVKAATVTVPTRLDVGTYDYTVEVYGTVGSYVTATATKTVRVTIVRKDISTNGHIVASYATFVYNGQAREGLLLLQDDQGADTIDMIKGSDYSVAYDKNTNAGSAEATITGLGNYCGTKTGSFLIGPKPLTVSTIEVDPIAAVTYKGSAYTPVVRVRSTSAPEAVLTLKTGSTGDYTVTYSRNVNAGTAVITITGQGNYGDTKTVNFTINKAPLTVTAEDKGTTYGENAPAFTATITGFVGSDTRASLFDSSDLHNGYRCSYVRGSNAGAYEIEPTQGSLAASNYSFAFVSGVLTVAKRALTVTADDATCVYGDPVPTYTVSCSALYGTDTKESVLGGRYRFGCAYVQGSGVGEYAITVATDELTNYQVTAHGSGRLTVTKKVLTLTADNYMIDYDEEAPVYGGTYSGFYGTDDESVVSGTALFLCAYVKGDDSGTYTITVDVSGLIAENYSFAGEAGELVVNKGVLSFAFALLTENGYDYVYNGRSKEISATLASGMCRTDVLTSFTLKYYRQYIGEGGVTYALDSLHRDAGVYKVVPEDLIINGSAEIQYEVAEDSYYMMTVTKLQVVVLIEEQTVVYDGEPHGTRVNFTLGEGDRLSSTFTLLYNGYAALPVNVGKYRVTILERDTANIVFAVGNQDNYEAFVYDDGIKYVEITKKSAVVTPTAIETIYGIEGTPNFTAEGILEKDGTPNCYYTYDGSRVMPTALGSYEIGVRILSGDPILSNYDVTYGTNVLTIAKRRLTVTADDVTRTFDGQPFDGTVTIGGDGILVAGTDHVPTGDRIAPVFAYNGNYEAVDAGTYAIAIVSASVIGGDNTVRDYYEFVSFVGGVMTIEKAAVRLTMTSEVVFNGRVRTYDAGTEGNGEPVWAYESGLVGGDRFGTATFAYYDENEVLCEVRNVGAYTVRITDFTLTSGNKNNYYVEAGALTVTPLSPVISVISRAETFNATPYFATADYTLGEGDAITYDYVYKKGAVITGAGAEEAGDWTVEVDLSSIVITSGEASNYGEFSFVAGVLTVNRRELVVTVGTQTKTYNGETQGVTAGVSGWAENGATPTAEITFTYFKEGVEVAPVLVGAYDVEIATAVVWPIEQRVNYFFTLDDEGKLVIADRELSFSVDPTASAGTFTYDGAAKHPLGSKIVIGGQGLVEGDTVEYVYNFRRAGGEWQDSAVYAGTWEAMLVDVTFPGQDSHYSITGDLSEVRFSVYIAPREMVVSVKSKEEVFDGRDKVGEAVGDTLVEGDEIVCDFEYPDGRKNVGVYSVIMSNVAIYHNGEDISDSYNFTVEPNGTITVTKCAFTVTVEDIPSGTDGYVYDGSAKVGRIRSNIGAEDTFTYTLSYVRANGEETDHTDAGEWRVYIDSVAFGAGVDLTNYEENIYVELSSGGRFVAGTQGEAYSLMIIDPRPVSVTIEDGRVTYDGNAHLLEEEYSGLIGGQTFSVGLLYSTDGETWTNEPVHAGVYTVKTEGVPTSLDYKASNYAFDCTDSATLTIEQRVIELGITTPGRPVMPFINAPYTLSVIVPDTPDHVLVYSTLLYAKDGGTPTLSPAMAIGSWEVTIGAAEIRDVSGETDATIVALWNRDYVLDRSAQVNFDIGKVKIMLSNIKPTSVYNGAEQMPQVVGDPMLSDDDELVITYRVTLGGAVVTPRDAGTYLITLENVEYRYKGNESTDHAEWYDIGYTYEYLRNYGEAGAWEFRIEKKEVTVTVNSIAAGTEGYVFNNQAHTTTASALGVPTNDFRYTLMYSRSGTVGSGVWVMQDIDQKWKVVNFDSMLAGDLAENEYVPVSAGVWNIAVKEVRTNNNYAFLYDNTVIAGTMTIDKRRTDLIVGGLDIEYDGEEHSVSVTASPRLLAGDTVSAELEYCLKSTFDADPTGATWVDHIKAVGDYYVRIKTGTAHSNVSSGSVENYDFIYPGVDDYGALSITKRRILFTLEDHTGTYNGGQHYPTVIANRLLDEDASLVRVVIDGYSFEGDNVNVNDGNCFAKIELAHLDAVGSLSAERLEYIRNNYQMNYEKGNVNEGRITIRPASIVFTLENKTVTYNGQAQTAEPIARGVVEGDVVTAYLSYGDNVNAGVCVVGITGAAVTTGRRTNYVFEDFTAVRGEIVIAPYAVNVSLEDAEVIYSGSEKQLTVTLDKALFNGDEAYLKQRIRYVRGNVTRYNPTDVGVWQASVESVWMDKDEKSNGNYDFYFRNVGATLTIQKARYDFTEFAAYLEAKAYAFTAEYNGQDQVPDFGDELPQGADSHLYTLRAVFDGTVREVGEGQKALTMTFRTYDLGGEAADSPNYERPTESYVIYFSLTAKALPVIWGPVRKRTGGDEFIAVEYSGMSSKPNATAEGENGTITLRVEVTGSDYGRVSDTPYHAVAMFEENSEEALNYTLTGDRTEFYVVKKSVGVQFFGYSGLVYNGLEQEIQVKVEDGGLVGDDRLPLVIRYDRMVRDAGTYTATVSVDEEQAGATLDNYELDGGVTLSFTVGKKEAVIIAGNLSSVYGSPLLSLSGKYTADGFTSGDLRTLSVNLTKEGGNDVGDYRIVPTAEMLNYNITFVSGVYTIRPKEIVVILHDQTQIDPLSSDLSQQQGVAWDVKDSRAIVGSDRLNVSLSTTVDLNDPSVKYGVIRASYSNPNYDVTFVGDADEEGVYAPYAKFLITKTQAVLSLKEDFVQAYPNASKVYDGKSVRLRVENSGNGSVSYIVNGVASDNVFVEPGVYNIVIKGTAKAQYYPPEDLRYTFTIYPNEIKTEFGSFVATVRDENGYSTAASFTMVEEKASESGVHNAFSFMDSSANKQISDYYRIESDGSLSGAMQLNLSAFYSDGQEVTVYIKKNNGEHLIETHVVKEGAITLNNVEEIEGIGFIQDDNGPGFLTIALFVAAGVLLLALFLIPVMKRRH